MENRDKKVVPDFATSGSLGVFLRKNTKKKKMLYAGVILNKQKKNIRGFLNKL